MLIPPRGDRWENDDVEGKPHHSVIEADLTEPGQYRVAVTSYKRGETGAYELHIDFGAATAESPTARQPRDVQRLCDENGIVPKIHRSVFERIARNTEGYAPGSLPADALVVSTAGSSAVGEAIRALVRDHHGSAIPLLRREARSQLLGRYAYWAFVYGVLATAALMLWHYGADAAAGSERWQQVVRNLANRLASSYWLGLLLQVLWQNKWLPVWLIVTFWIGDSSPIRCDMSA